MPAKHTLHVASSQGSVKFVRDQVAAGRYLSASAVVAAALDLLKDQGAAGPAPTPGNLTEQALRDNNAYIRLLLDSTAEGFYAVDTEGHTTTCNPTFLRMLGFADEAAVVGRKLHDVIHHSHPDGTHYPVGDCPIYACASEGTPAHVTDEYFYRLDGAPIPVEYWAHPIVRDGVLQGAICTFFDVTERKQAEEALRASEAQFRSFAQAMPSHVWTSPPNGLLDWFNDRVFEYSGMSASELNGEGWARMVHPDDIGAAAQRWGASLGSGETYETEFRLQRLDGVYRWHLARAVAIRNEAGEITRWVGANTDIEDQKATTRALADLNATLEDQVERRTSELMAAEESLRQSQKMEAIGQLTGGIAHDFNNLLTGIIGSLDLIRRRTAAGRTDDVERFMDAASTSAQRAAALTHRLLAFARRQSLDTKPQDVNALVAGTDDLLRRTLGEHIALDVRPQAGLWRGLADDNQLENALLNLAINARDAMPDGGKLTVETANAVLDQAYARLNDDVEPGDYVVVSVSDTGEGMAADVIAKAFDPFFTTKPIGQGTGLGLSMVYGFVKQSGGHVRIYSEVGQGTSVKLYLRRAPDDGDQTSVADEASLAGGQGETVLVVEDDPTVRMLVIEVLQELGYNYLQADDGLAALPLLKADQPIDLLVTDVGLPNMNGRQLAEIARQDRPGLKVLFITGYAENAAVRGGFLEPGMDMMTKPFALTALAAKIRQLIEN